MKLPTTPELGPTTHWSLEREIRRMNAVLAAWSGRTRGRIRGCKRDQRIAAKSPFISIADGFYGAESRPRFPKYSGGSRRCVVEVQRRGHVLCTKPPQSDNSVMIRSVLENDRNLGFPQRAYHTR